MTAQTATVPDSIRNLFRQSARATAVDKKVWNLPLHGLWIPVLHANRVNGVPTGVEAKELGAPIVLSRAKDGSIRFGSNGKPVTRVQPTIRKFVTIVQQNMAADLLEYATMTRDANPDAYAASVQEAAEAGHPIAMKDTADLAYAIEKMETEAEASNVTKLPAAA